MESWVRGLNHRTANATIGNDSEVRILHFPHDEQQEDYVRIHRGQEARTHRYNVRTVEQDTKYTLWEDLRKR